MKATVGVSNRHVHLTKETFKYLFGKEELQKRNDLNQVGEFASLEYVDLRNGDKIIEKVRIVGPFREHNQIELSNSDLDYLKMQAPIRRSGELDNTPNIELCVGDKSILSSGVIRAERHVHVPSSREDELGLHERDKVDVFTPNGSFDALVKVSDNGYFEVHIDRDDAQEYGLKSGDEVDVVLCGK